MAAEPFHSLGGFTTGIPVIEVVDANGNVVTNVNTSGNVSANIIYANEFKFANGDPLTASAAGSNTQVQYNNDDTFGADSTFTFDQVTKTLAVSNFVASGNLVNLGDVESLHISGGLNGYVLQTDGAGNLSWTAQTGNGGGNGSPGGSNMQVQFNDAGDFGGDAEFFYDKDTNLLTVTYISADGNKLSNLAGANITGEVSFAAVANSVAVSNVSGIGNIAVINLDGNSSNVLYGNGIFAAVTGGGGNGTPGGSNTQLQFNDDGSFGGISTVTFDKTSGNLSISSNTNFSSAPNVNFAVANLHITGGVNGYFLQTDGTGNLSWALGGGGGNGEPGGSNTQVQFNDAGVFGGSSKFTFNKTSNVLTVNGNISAGNISGTLTTASQPNITTVGTLSSLLVSSSITALGTIVAPVVQGTVAVQAGDLSATNEVNFSLATSINLANIDIISIGGGSDGYVLTTDGTGNLSWETVSINSAGANTQIQFNDDGAFNASSSLTFDKSSNVLTANSITIGAGAYKFQNQKVYFATTSSGATGQIIFEIPVTDIYGADFVIITDDATGNARQITKLNSLILGTYIEYNEISTLVINAFIADFTIDYTAGNLTLRVTPSSSNFMNHRMLITSYNI